MKKTIDWVIHLVANRTCSVCGKEENGFLPYTCNAHTHGMERYGHLDFQVVLFLPPNEIARILNPMGLRVQNGERFRLETMFPVSMRTAQYGWTHLRKLGELCCVWSFRTSMVYSQRMKTVWKHISCSNCLQMLCIGKAVSSRENENLSDHSRVGHPSHKVHGLRGHAPALWRHCTS